MKPYYKQSNRSPGKAGTAFKKSSLTKDIKIIQDAVRSGILRLQHRARTSEQSEGGANPQLDSRPFSFRLLLLNFIFESCRSHVSLSLSKAILQIIILDLLAGLRQAQPDKP